MPVVWVTGASSGLGMHTAQALRALGWQVVGGARSFTRAQEPGWLRLPLDVTDEANAAAFAEEALAAFGPPDALVNAAGILILGACADYAPQELQRVMDTNFLGMARMVRLTLPVMLARGQGRIVNYSSVNGLLATPFQGAYSASKHAVEGFSEALRMENAPHGIQVMVVEPGDHRGGQPQYRARCQARDSRYAAAYDAVCAAIARDEAQGGDPARLGRKVAKAMARPRMPARLRVTRLPETAAIVLHDLLPSGLFLKLLSLYYGAGRKNAPG